MECPRSPLERIVRVARVEHTHYLHRTLPSGDTTTFSSAAWRLPSFHACVRTSTCKSPSRRGTHSVASEITASYSALLATPSLPMFWLSIRLTSTSTASPDDGSSTTNNACGELSRIATKAAVCSWFQTASATAESRPAMSVNSDWASITTRSLDAALSAPTDRARKRNIENSARRSMPA
jgi:hypothetical protein